METLWSEMSEIIFIKSKVYSYLSQHQNKMTNKGVSKVAMRHNINHQYYDDCLNNNFQNYVNYKNGYTPCKINDLNTYTKQFRMGSEKLEMYVYESNKLTLSNYDDKRFISPIDGITTYAHGYF